MWGAVSILIHGSISSTIFGTEYIYMRMWCQRATERASRRGPAGALSSCQGGLHRQHLQQHWRVFQVLEWLFCWITEYPQSQGPWPWAQQIFSAEYDLIPREVKLFLPVAKKTSKLSNHSALRDAWNLLRQPTGRKNHKTLELLGSIKSSLLYRIRGV